MYSFACYQAYLAFFAILMTVLLPSLPGEPTRRPVRATSCGRVQGYVHTLPTGGKVERYLGVPYAAPPVGDLRFERPKPPKPWKQVLHTTKISPACMQENMDQEYILNHKPDYDGSMAEDCLYLNIYVPTSRPSNGDAGMAVLVYMHGGSNGAGMGAMLDGDVIADTGKIIVITFNYRLGIFGFLYVPHRGIHGNYGLYDQTQALTWIKENIAYFGGDPSKVTILGHSAGSIDVGFHVISPKSKGLYDVGYMYHVYFPLSGLFRAAILQSGSPVAYWAMVPKSKEGDTTRGPLHHLYSLGCFFGDDSDSTLRCLRKLSAIRIIKGQYKHEKGYYSFLPVVDGDFVPEAPISMMQRIQKGEKYSTNCDTIVVGIVNDEGSLTAEVIIKNALESAGRLVDHEKHYTFPPEDLNIWDEAPPLKMFPYNSIHAYHELTMYLYTPWHDRDNATANVVGISNMVGDCTFLAPAVHVASLLSGVKDTSVYFYNFHHISSTSLFPAWMGVPHGEDQFYLFGSPVVGHSSMNYTQVDKAVSLDLIKLWAEFVKQKKVVHPDGSFVLAKFTPQDENYVEMTSDRDGIILSAKRNLRKEYTYFWNQLIPVLATEPPVQVTSEPGFVQWILVALLCVSVIICVVLAILLRKARKKHE